MDVAPDENHLNDHMLMKELAEVLLTTLKEDIDTESEPFERYVHQLKMRLHNEKEPFQQRFVKGYDVLMQTLANLSDP